MNLPTVINIKCCPASIRALHPEQPIDRSLLHSLLLLTVRGLGVEKRNKDCRRVIDIGIEIISRRCSYRRGVDLRTVQSWLGHKDLESTMRYLKPARGKDAQEKLSRTFAGIQLQAELASAAPVS